MHEISKEQKRHLIERFARDIKYYCGDCEDSETRNDAIRALSLACALLYDSTSIIDTTLQFDILFRAANSIGISNDDIYRGA